MSWLLPNIHSLSDLLNLLSTRWWLRVTIGHNQWRAFAESESSQYVTQSNISNHIKNKNIKLRRLYHSTRSDSHRFFRLDINLGNILQNWLDNYIGNILRPHWITMALTKNIYVTYHDGNWTEFIQLNKGAIIDFKASEKIDLTRSNADAFAECMDRTSKLYAYYGYLCQFPNTMTVAPDGMFTLGNHANFIETWNRIRINTVPNNVNMTWGDK